MWDTIEFSQYEYIIGISTFKNMWNYLYSIYVT